MKQKQDYPKVYRYTAWGFMSGFLPIEYIHKFCSVQCHHREGSSELFFYALEECSFFTNYLPMFYAMPEQTGLFMEPHN